MERIDVMIEQKKELRVPIIGISEAGFTDL
jgi:hypothetical protein